MPAGDNGREPETDTVHAEGEGPGGAAIRWIWLIYLVFLAVVLIPIWSVTHPPLQDYPNHLARMFLIGHVEELPLREFYEISWRLVPKLASDLVIPALNWVFSLEVSGKIFISLTFFLLTFSVSLLSKEIHRAVTPISFAAFLFLYNFAFYKGFLNFLFSCSLAFLGVLAWIRLSQQAPWRRILFGSAISLFLFVSHLYGLAVYGLLTLAHDFFAARKDGKTKPRVLGLAAWRWGAQFILPGILFFSVSTTGSAMPKPGDLITDIFRVVSDQGWIARKVEKLAYLFPRIEPGLDVLLYLLVVAALIVAVREQRGRSRNFVLISVAAGLVLYLFMPRLLLTSAHADWRILVPLGFLTFGAIPWPRTGKWMEAGTLAVIGTMVMAQTVIVTRHWEKGERLYQNYKTIAERLPTGARVFPYSNTSDDLRLILPIPIIHMPSFAVVDRKVFLPTLFAYESQQVLSYTQPYRELAWRHRYVFYGERVLDWAEIQQRYDFALNLDDLSHGDMSKLPKGWAVEVSAGPFTLLKPDGP